MPYIIYSLAHGAPVAMVDAALQDLTLRDGEVAIPCVDSDSPSDPRWAEEAAQYDVKYALSNAKVLQTALMSQSCQDAIYVGFTSSALGATFTYPFKDKDQTNLNGDVSLSMLPTGQASGWTTTFWCADSAGDWEMRAHTATQIQQVGMDAASAKLACVNKNIALATQIAAATTIEAVQAITWS